MNKFGTGERGVQTLPPSFYRIPRNSGNLKVQKPPFSRLFLYTFGPVRIPDGRKKTSKNNLEAQTPEVPGGEDRT